MNDEDIFGPDEKDQTQKKIFIATFSMLSKLTDVDGTVDKAEISAIDRFMKTVLNLDEARRKFAIKAFNEARRSPLGFREYAEQYRELLKQQPRMLEWMIDVLLRISMADSVFSKAEERLLKIACEVFGVSESRFAQLRARYVKDRPEAAAPDIAPYQILLCSPDCSAEELDRQYKKLLSDYSPQRIKELGLPVEFVLLAKERTKIIEEAYQTICKARDAS